MKKKYRSMDFPYELFETLLSYEKNCRIHRDALAAHKKTNPWWTWYWDRGDGPTILTLRDKYDENGEAKPDFTCPEYGEYGMMTGYVYQISGFPLEIYENSEAGIGVPAKIIKTLSLTDGIFGKFPVIANTSEGGRVKSLSPLFNQQKDLDRFVDQVEQLMEDLEDDCSKKYDIDSRSYLRHSIGIAEWLFLNNPER